MTSPDMTPCSGKSLVINIAVNLYLIGLVLFKGFAVQTVQIFQFRHAGNVLKQARLCNRATLTSMRKRKKSSKSRSFVRNPAGERKVKRITLQRIPLQAQGLDVIRNTS